MQRTILRQSLPPLKVWFRSIRSLAMCGKWRALAKPAKTASSMLSGIPNGRSSRLPFPTYRSREEWDQLLEPIPGTEAMIRFTSLTQRFAVWFLAVSVLPIMIIGYSLLRTFETETQKTAIRQVSAIADMKAEQIDSYLRERLLDARVIQTASTTRMAMRDFARCICQKRRGIS